MSIHIHSVFLARIVSTKIENPIRKNFSINKFQVFLISGFASAILIKFSVTSAKEFTSIIKHEYEHILANTLLQYPAVYADNMNERLFVKSRINLENNHPNVIILGSSRVMQISERIMSNSVLNLAVSGSSLEDAIATGVLASEKLKPSTIIIGGDPWLFNIASGQDRWKAIADDYYRGLEKLTPDHVITSGNQSSRKEKEKEKEKTTLLSSIYYTIHSNNYGSYNDGAEYRDKIRRDGSRVYNITFANHTQSEIMREFDGLIKYSMQPYVFSNELYDRFSLFINFLKKNTTVVILLSPYHPKLYDRITNENPLISLLENQYRTIAAINHIKIIGSYNPKLFSCSDDEFYDGMHPKDSCIKKIIKTM